jgi:hypothetical protein
VLALQLDAGKLTNRRPLIVVAMMKPPAAEAVRCYTDNRLFRKLPRASAKLRLQAVIGVFSAVLRLRIALSSFNAINILCLMIEYLIFFYSVLAKSMTRLINRSK